MLSCPCCMTSVTTNFYIYFLSVKRKSSKYFFSNVHLFSVKMKSCFLFLVFLSCVGKFNKQTKKQAASFKNPNGVEIWNVTWVWGAQSAHTYWLPQNTVKNQKNYFLKVYNQKKFRNLDLFFHEEIVRAMPPAPIGLT